MIGLGSVGVELERLDEYSDLDFFVIVEPGSKANFLQDLSWLADVQPVAYAFQNTVDGYKLLFADGIFCEFAVFEPGELATVPFAPGRVVWKRAKVSDTIGQPQLSAAPETAPIPEWLLGEALTNLYVGLCRYRRGEILSATRFIQGYAVDRVVQLIELIAASDPGNKDPFTPERRFERRYPRYAGLLSSFVQGYDHCPASALAILDFLQGNFEVNQNLASAIQTLCTPGEYEFQEERK